MKTIIVDEKLAGKRLDEALVSFDIAPSRTAIKEMIKEGRILVNNEKAKPAYILCISDIITAQKYTKKELDAIPEDLPINIVYEDDDVLVINKPRGLVVHPGNGHSDKTLVNALLFHEKNLPSNGNALRPGIVHRIDKDTSGLLVVAKNMESMLFLQDQLKDHSMHREYIALVKGIISENKGKIDAPIGRDPSSPIKFAVNLKKGKEAITYFDVVERYEEKLTLITCRLLTGRTHQIRVHLNYIKHPIEGDPLYGNNNQQYFSRGQLLHAYRLTFVHPKTKELLSFEAPIPEEFKDVLNKLHPLAS